MKNDTLTQYIKLFGLDGAFTEQELSSAYRTLAKLNHPDVNKNSDAKMRMIIINEGYNYLKAHTSTPQTSDDAELFQQTAYNYYKKAFEIMKNAFDDYYGTESSKSFINDIDHLKIRLTEAKTEMKKIINEYPNSEWTEDAIDKIFMINKWFK